MAAEDCAWKNLSSWFANTQVEMGAYKWGLTNVQIIEGVSECLILFQVIHPIAWSVWNTVVRPCFHWKLFCNCFPNIVCDSLTLQPTSERPLIGIKLREIPATKVGPVFLPFLLESSWGKFLHVRGGSNVFVHCWCWGGGLGEGEY